MPLETAYQKYVLDFKFNAGTSRGVLKEKKTFYIKIWDAKNPRVYGLGECSPLKKLSIDDREDFEAHLSFVLNQLRDYKLPDNTEEVYEIADKLAGKNFPAIRFGLEVALLDLLNGGTRLIFEDNTFYKGTGIPINGLVWMGSADMMQQQVVDKIAAGYDCIKMKIGSLDFEKECALLQDLRQKHQKIMLRLDANGAFKAQDALHKLQVLDQFNIHSIEQPIAPGNWHEMNKLCSKAPFGIALDEELIGIYTDAEKQQLLQEIQPQYIILKPTLLGGIKICEEWIRIADAMQIGWWLTSALESNIGLNAICQFAAQVKAAGHQGLGTGQLYHNNIVSPLQIRNGHIFYDPATSWSFSNLEL